MAAQRVRDLSGPLGTLARVLLEAAQDDVLQLLPDLRAQGAGRLRVLVDDAVEDRLNVPGERRLADEALVEDDPERVDVRAAVERARGHLLGGEVGDGADQGAGLGEPGLRGRVRETEVHHADADAWTPLRARS